MRPFAGEGVYALAEAVQSGVIRAVPESAVPRWLDALVRRGLSSDPADRFDGMAEVAAALAKRRRSIAGRVTPAVLLLATGGVTTWALAAGDDPLPPCPFDASEWEGVWDATTRERVEGAMARVQIPSAEHAWLRISAELDVQTAEVSRMRVEACEATRVRGVQSDDLLDRRMVCLDRVRDQIAASIDVLQEADREVVLHVDELLAEIPPLQRCADAEYLAARIAPPPDPDAAAEAEAIRQLVGEAASQRAVTRLDAALRTAEEARRRAVDLDYAPVSAEATYALGDVHESRAAYEEAERLYREAYWIASDVGHDEAVLRIASDLGFVIADAMGKPEEGLVWLRHAESAARRAGLDEWLDRLRAHRAAFEVMGGDAEAAIPILEEVAASMAADDPRRAAVYGNLGAAFAQLGRWDRAFEAQQKALAIAERTYGVDHPEYAKVLANLATAEATAEGFAEAERMLRRSVAIYEHTYREPHPFMAQALCSLGTLASDQGRYAEAIDAFERCNEVVVETLGENHPGRASALVNIGNALAETGRFAEAVDRYREAIVVDEQTLPPEHPDRAFALLGVGTSLMRLDRAAEAIEPLERAVAVRDADAIEPSIRATAELALARALWRSGRDRPRARALAEAARRHTADAGKPVPAVPIDEWLAQD